MSVSSVKNAAQARAYFTEDNYYRENDSQVTEWGGKLAVENDLAGKPVDKDQFLQVLNGHMPDGQQVQKGAGKAHKPATDLTFNAPKSVSLAAFNAGDTRVIDAQRRAVAATMEYAEREFAACRITENGKTTQTPTGKMMYARFTHDTNRLEESHLHDHVLVLNVTEGKDGSLRALENHPLYKNQMLLGAIYHAELRNEMENLGYTTRDTENAKNGEFEINEIDSAFAGENSTRRRQVVDYLQKRGLDPAKATQKQLDTATKATREAKRAIDHAALHRRNEAEFKQRFADWQRPELAPAQQAAQAAEHGQRPAKALDFALNHFLEKTNAVDKTELLKKAVIESDGVHLKDLEAEFSRRIADGRLIEGQGKYTTSAAQQRERDMLASVDRGKAAMPAILSAERAESFLAPLRATPCAPNPTLADTKRSIDERRPPRLPALNDFSAELRHAGAENKKAEANMLTGKLNDGQQRAAELMLTSRDRVNVIQGVAGAGKTFMLESVRGEIEANGRQIIGLAPSHQASGELREVIGQGETLQAFLTNTRAHSNLSDKNVIILDEAGMASSQQMSDLMRITEKSGSQVFLIGDDRQFKAVEAGNPFRQIQKHGVAMAEMTDSVRQKDNSLREAVKLMNAGKMRDGLAKLPINEIKDKAARHRQIATDYLAQGADRKKSLVLTGTNADRRALNDIIRRDLGLAGQGKEIEVMDKVDLSGADQRKAKNYAAGQVVQFHTDMKSLGVKAKDNLTVDRIDTARGIVTLRNAGGKEVEFKPHEHKSTKAWSVLKKEKLEFSVGDEVRFRSSQKTGRDADGRSTFDWNTNDRGRVVAIDQDKGMMRISNDSKGGREVDIDISKPAMLTHSYAATGHSAQGMTVNKTFADFDSGSQTTSKESIYTNSTRARNETVVYTDSTDNLMSKSGQSIDKSNALDVQPGEAEKKEEKETPAPTLELGEPNNQDRDSEIDKEIADGRADGEATLAKTGGFYSEGYDHSGGVELDKGHGR